MNRRAAQIAPILAALVAFLVTASVAHHLLPPTPTRITRKLDHFWQRADEYTTVFVGSSVVFRQIDPRQFDAELRRAGVSARSYNLGADAMSLGEEAHLVHAILEARPARLRTLFLDVSWPVAGDFNEQGPRFVAWHDPGTTLRSIDASWAESAPIVLRVGNILGDVRAALRNATRTGVLAELGWGDPVRIRVGDEGFVPLELPGADGEPARQAQLAEYRVQRQALLERPDRQSPSPAYPRRMIAAMVADCRAHGVAAILLRAPVTWENPTVDADAPFFDFHDPRRYPDLFDPEVRFDDDHLNPEGGRRYTGYIAQRFIDWAHAVR